MKSDSFFFFKQIGNSLSAGKRKVKEIPRFNVEGKID